MTDQRDCRHYKLLGGPPSEGELDAEAQLQLADLLKQWGADITSTEERARARALADAALAKNADEPLFKFNPYRPQQRMGFRGTAMWDSLLAELPATLSEAQRRGVARIFRVDDEHNALVQKALAKQDVVCEAVAEELVQRARRENNCGGEE